MKVLIAYDGSERAHTAIDGLRRAGLPIEADAPVVSVAEVWLPMAEHEACLNDTFPTEISGLDGARTHAIERMKLVTNSRNGSL